MSEQTLAEQTAAVVQNSRSLPADHPISAILREQDELGAAAIPDAVMPVGTTLEDAALLDPQGAATTLHRAVGDRLAVLVFYRGAWCPYCNLALKAYQQQLLPELDRRGIGLIAISPQKPDESLSLQEKQALGFGVLSDDGNVLARRLGILTAPTPGARAAQLQLGLDITAGNADGTTGIPMPTTVIIDADHVVRWIDVHPDYTTRTEPSDIVAALDSLGLG
jgi:peroxiredoxin